MVAGRRGPQWVRACGAKRNPWKNTRAMVVQVEPDTKREIVLGGRNIAVLNADDSTDTQASDVKHNESTWNDHTPPFLVTINSGQGAPDNPTGEHQYTMGGEHDRWFSEQVGTVAEYSVSGLFNHVYHQHVNPFQLQNAYGTFPAALTTLNDYFQETLSCAL